MIKGVQSVEPGYAGPAHKTAHGPSYEEVSTGTTPYVEAARLVYDPDTIAFPELLQVYFGSHDPTQANGQGADIGPQYRSVVFYTTKRQREMTEHYIKMLGPNIVTTVEPLDNFYRAEDYHQNYYANNRTAGYCQLIIDPKVESIRQKYKTLLK